MNYLLLIICLACASITLNAQTTQIQEPEWVSNVIYVNDIVGNGIALEKQKIYSSTKTSTSLKLIGVGKVSGENCVKGEESPIEIRLANSLQFIVKAESNKVDPAILINIIELESSKDKRCIELASINSLGDSRSGDMDYVSFTAKKYGESSYLITIPEIKIGEFAIILDGYANVYNLFQVTGKDYKVDVTEPLWNFGDTVYFLAETKWQTGIVQEIRQGLLVEFTNTRGKSKQRRIQETVAYKENPNN